MPQENKERYTPGPWKFESRFVFTERPSYNNPLAIVISPEDAHLIVEAPAMFPLLKQFIMSHVVAKGGELCDCNDCRAAKRIIARVLGEE